MAWKSGISYIIGKSILQETIEKWKAKAKNKRKDEMKKQKEMATGLKHPGYIVHGVSGFRDTWASSFGRQEGDHQRVLVASPGAGHINSTPIPLHRAQAHEPIWLQVELRCRPAMCPEIKEKTLVTSHLVHHKASSTIVLGSQTASNCPQEWPSYSSCLMRALHGGEKALKWLWRSPALNTQITCPSHASSLPGKQASAHRQKSVPIEGSCS